jgi:hypothetical protein
MFQYLSFLAKVEPNIHNVVYFFVLLYISDVICACDSAIYFRSFDKAKIFAIGIIIVDDFLDTVKLVKINN